MKRLLYKALHLLPFLGESVKECLSKMNHHGIHELTSITSDIDSDPLISLSTSVSQSNMMSLSLLSETDVTVSLSIHVCKFTFRFPASLLNEDGRATCDE